MKFLIAPSVIALLIVAGSCGVTPPGNTSTNTGNSPDQIMDAVAEDCGLYDVSVSYDDWDYCVVTRLCSRNDFLATANLTTVECSDMWNSISSGA